MSVSPQAATEPHSADQSSAKPAKTCRGSDPMCPCQDGDACHYEDGVSTKAMPLPSADSRLSQRRGLTGRELIRAECLMLIGIGAPSLFDGITTREERAGRLRAYLVARGMEDAPASSRSTYRQAFEILYGEAL